MAQIPRRYQRPGRRSGAQTKPFFDLCVPAHAYLFGLLQTDGHHYQGTRNRGRVTIELSIRDEALLHRFRELVPWYSSIRYRERQTNFAQRSRTAIWTLSSWDARSELAALGLPPGRKSESAAPPSSPTSHRDYVRGLIDGDGSLGFTSAGNPFVSFVSASEPLVRFVEAYILQITGVERHSNRNARDGVFNPMIQTDAAALLADHLYSDGDLALDRKAAMAGLVARWVRPTEMRRSYTSRRWSADEDVAALADRSIAEIALDLGRSYRSVSLRRSRLRLRSKG